MIDTPKEFSIKNGAFCGYRFIAGEERSVGGFSKTKVISEPHWLFFTIDLRQVTHMSEHGPDDRHLTDIYNGQTHVATLNAPIHAIIPDWRDMLHAFERIPCTEEGRRTMEVMMNKDRHP